VIDRLREQIQHRIDQLTAEVDRLHKALTALGPRTAKPPAGKQTALTTSARKPARATSARAAAATPSARQRRTRPSANGSSSRTPTGATKSAVLAALAGGQAMTAGQVAEQTGLGRATVSTTLSKLSKSGEVQKAERGYRRAAK